VARAVAQLPDGANHHCNSGYIEASNSTAMTAMFPASGKLANCLRLNCAVRWDGKLKRALVALSRLL
jgi:hypothetical protein